MGFPEAHTINPCRHPCNCPPRAESGYVNPQIAKVGTATTDVNVPVSFKRVDITRSECFNIPLKAGGVLNLAWNRFSMYNTVQQSYPGGNPATNWKPAGSGAVFGFLPRVNVWLSQSRRVVTDEGTLDFNASGVAISPIADSAVLGTTYFTTFEPVSLTYYEYFAGTGILSTDLAFGLLNRRYDLRGNELNYTYNFGTNYQLDRISGSLAGNVIPYFFYSGVAGSPISKIFLADQVTPASSRTYYFEYLMYRDIASNQYPYLSRIISPDGCVKKYDAVTPTTTGAEDWYKILREIDAEGYQTYFSYPAMVEPEGRITYYNWPSFGIELAVIGRKGKFQTWISPSGTGYVPLMWKQSDDLQNTTYWGYDSVTNRISAEIAANGAITYFTYVGVGANPFAMTSRVSAFNGATVYFGYGPSGFERVKETGPRDRQGVFPVATYFTYDSVRNQTSIIDPLGNTTLLGRDGLGRISALVDALGRVTYFNYSPGTAGLISKVLPDKNVVYYKYDSFMSLTAEVSPRWSEQSQAAFTTYYTYDQLSQQKKKIDPLGNVTYFDWTSRGDLLGNVDALGVSTSYTYNGLRLMTQRTVTTSAGAVLAQDKHGYDIYKNRIRSLDARGNATYFFYDPLDRLIARETALQECQYFFYDSMSNPVVLVDPRGNAIYHFYDALTRKTGTRDALGNLTYFYYDLADNRTLAVDARLNATYFFYDALDRMNVVRDALGNATYYFFDKAGNETVQTDPRFNSTYFFYDLRNLLSATRNALGNTTYFGYDAATNRVRLLDARNNPTYYFYDTLDRLQAVRNAAGDLTYYFYDAVGNRTVLRDAVGSVTYFFNDGLRRITAHRDSLLNCTYFYFDAAGNRTHVRDARGNMTYFFYDAGDRLSVRSDALGNGIYFFYDVAGNQSCIRSPRGLTTYFIYDRLNRLATGVYADGSKVLTEYDAVGNCSRVRAMDALASGGYGSQKYGSTFYGGWQPGDMSLSYDALNRISAAQDPQGNWSYFFYDPAGNRTTVRNQNAHATYFGYDALNRLSAKQNSLGATVYYEYDGVGNKTKIVDADNRASFTRFDVLNRIDASRAPDGGSAYFFYDPLSSRTRIVDPRGNTTYYGFDRLSRLAAVQDALGRSIYFEYDPAGSLSRGINAEGSSQAHTYDAVNRRTQTTLAAAGADIGASLRSDPYYVYDQVGNLTRMGDLWGLHQMTYDGLNRMAGHVFPKGQTVYYEYNFRSQPTAIVYPGTSGKQSAAYDVSLRQTLVQAPSGATAYFSYDAVSNLTRRQLANSVKQDVTYDEAERIRLWRNTNAAGVPLTYFDYTRDPKGLVTKAVREATNAIYYSYDSNDRLLSEIWCKTGASPSEVYGYRYSYDLAGNRIKAKINGTDTYYFYDAGNQLRVTGATSAWSTPSYYLYDRNGSLTNLVEPAGATYFAYNAAGLLARIRWKDASATYFYYDGLQQRYAMTAVGTTTYFLWDGPNLLQELNADGTVKEEYANARMAIAGIGQLLEINRPGQSPQKVYPVMDPRGTITKLVQSDGTTVQAAKEYDAFGNVIPNSSTGTWIGRMTYQGQSWLEITSADATKRLLLSPTRAYDPVMGRFLQPDPLIQERPLSHYLYCSNNPVTNVDPSGLDDVDHHIFNKFMHTGPKYDFWSKLFGPSFHVDDYTVPIERAWHEIISPKITTRWNEFIKRVEPLLEKAMREGDCAAIEKLQREALEEMLKIAEEFKYYDKLKDVRPWKFHKAMTAAERAAIKMGDSLERLLLLGQRAGITGNMLSKGLKLWMGLVKEGLQKGLPIAGHLMTAYAFVHFAQDPKAAIAKELGVSQEAVTGLFEGTYGITLDLGPKGTEMQSAILKDGSKIEVGMSLANYKWNKDIKNYDIITIQITGIESTGKPGEYKIWYGPEGKESRIVSGMRSAASLERPGGSNF